MCSTHRIRRRTTLSVVVTLCLIGTGLQWLDPRAGAIEVWMLDGPAEPVLGGRPGGSGEEPFAVAALAAAGVIPPYRDMGGAWTEQGGFTQDDPDSPSFFGYAFDFDGDFAIVGAHMSSGVAPNAGAAYIYQRDRAGQWNLYQTLTAPDAAANDHFGVAVAIDGGVAAVGAYKADGVGAVYCYVLNRKGQWILRQKLQAPRLDLGDNFGITVALDGAYLVVGADGDDEAEDDAGAVYVFRGRGRYPRNGRKLIPHDVSYSDQVGLAVAIDGDWIAVGAEREGSDQGAVYMYKRRGARWLQYTKLTSIDRDAGDLFGCSVSLRDGRLLVGARGDDAPERLNAGAAYTYRLTGAIWVWESWFRSTEPMTDGLFGTSVALKDDLAIVGAPGESVHGDPNSRTGAAYLFHRPGGQWADLARIAASDGRHDDYFGVATAFDATTPVVGAPKWDPLAEQDLGALYFFSRCPPADLNGDCIVNFLDLAVLAGQWSGPPANPKADFSPFDVPGRVDYFELAGLADLWLQDGN